MANEIFDEQQYLVEMGQREAEQHKHQEICDLTCELSAPVCKEAGDYHMLKMMDALVLSDKFWELFGDLDLPYTREEITAVVEARQSKRDRIKELRKELEGV